MPSSSGAKVITLIGASSWIFFINSIEGLWAKGGCTPRLFGLIKGPSKWTPNILVLVFL